MKNPYGKEYPEGYMKLKLHTRPVEASNDLKNLVTACVSVYPDHPAGLYYVPKGKSRREREVRSAYEGKAMMFGGHIHQHGTRPALEKVLREPAKPNEIVWEGKFEEAVHHEFKLPATVLEAPLEIQKTDLYKLVVEYDNTSQRDWPAMGFVCALTAPKV